MRVLSAAFTRGRLFIIGIFSLPLAFRSANDGDAASFANMNERLVVDAIPVAMSPNPVLQWSLRQRLAPMYKRI